MNYEILLYFFIAIYLFFISFVTETGNLKSTILLRYIPFLIGVYNLFLLLVHLNWEVVK